MSKVHELRFAWFSPGELVVPSIGDVEQFRQEEPASDDEDDEEREDEDVAGGPGSCPELVVEATVE